MRIISLATVALFSAAVLGLAGCASVPKEELNQANTTALLVQNFQTEVQNFKSVQATVAANRVASMENMRKLTATVASDATFDDRVAKIAGQDARLNLFTALKNHGDSRAKDAQDLDKVRADIDAGFAAMVSPLPDISPALDTTRKTLATLGSDLSLADRIKATADFAKDVRDAVDKNLKQIQDAKADAAATTAAVPAQ